MSTTKAGKLYFNSLKGSLNHILKHNCHGSKSTQANRGFRLNQIIRDLHDIGFKKMNDINQLKTRHVDKLVQYYVDKLDSKDLSAGTVKNRMSDLRWIRDYR